MIYKVLPYTLPVDEAVTFEGPTTYAVEELVNEALALNTGVRLRGPLEYEALESESGSLVHRVTVTFTSKLTPPRR